MKFDCRFLCQMFKCYVAESEHVRSVNASHLSNAYRIPSGFSEVYPFWCWCRIDLPECECILYWTVEKSRILIFVGSDHEIFRLVWSSQWQWCVLSIKCIIKIRQNGHSYRINQIYSIKFLMRSHSLRHNSQILFHCIFGINMDKKENPVGIFFCVSGKIDAEKRCT